MQPRPLSHCIALFALVFALFPHTARVHAQPAIPEALRPWQGWVLEGNESERCPIINGVRTCVFPTALSLDVSKTGGTFSQRVTLEQEETVALPGSTEHFPLDVRVDKKAIPVLDTDGTPRVRLPAGTHALSGRFQFQGVPDSLRIPQGLALLTLTVDGARIGFPKRDAGGLLWLKQSGDSAEEERLSLSVHRKLDDGVPVLLTTRLHVSAAGKAREVVLPNVLVPGTRPIELQSGVPAELTPEGALRVQVNAGEHDLTLIAIRETSVETFVAPRAAEPWPERELWVVRTDERLRHVEVTGPSQIDPARTDLAADWRGMPTYVMPPQQTLKLETRRRGEPEPPPNQLHLQRTLWLDLDGDGYTVRDELTGTMNRHFRLDLLASKLGHVVDRGEDQLITLHRAKSGVELRQKGLALRSEWRLEHGQTQLPAVGYDENVDSLRADLNLPPGFLLLATEGVDHVSNTWLDSWDLFDFFFVLLISLAVAKLAGPGYGAVALLALVLTHHEPDAPAVAWVLLLSATALVVALKLDRFSNIMRFGWLFALLCLVLVLLPFSVMQVRKALYPQLDETGVTGAIPVEYSALEMAAEPAPPPAPAPSAAPGADEAAQKAEALLRGALESGGGSLADTLAGGSVDGREHARHGNEEGRMDGYAKSASSYKSEVDPSAIVQTGPGLPSWQFRHYSLSWSGPVQKGQNIRLFIAPPLVTRAWALASVLFSALLLFGLAQVFRRAQSSAPSRSQPPPPSGETGTIITMVVLLSSLFGAGTAHAQALPSTELLTQLKERLLKAPECAPDCLSVASLALRIEGARVQLRAEVHAEAESSYQAPGPLESWAPDSIRVDGKDAFSAVRSDDGFLHVRVFPGVHVVELSGPVPRSQAFTLTLGTTPHYVSAEHKGYLVDGLRDDGRAEGSLSIRREVRESDAQEPDTQSLVQWFEVRRELDLGVRFRIRTTVTRLGPATDSTLVRIPLLPGEAINEAGLVSDAQGVVVELPRGEKSKTFSSGMQPGPKLTLTAATSNGTSHPFSEVWVVAPSVLYRPTFDGIAPIQHVDGSGLYQPTFRPFPGERVTIGAERLSGAEGASVTVDSAEVLYKPGSRMEQATITLHVRTSRGTTEQLALPKNAQLTSVHVDGAARPARLSQGKLELHLDPGSHLVVVNLQQPGGIQLAYKPMKLASARGLGNVTTQVQVPSGRWLLWARGPAWGPAVLFWGYLLVVMLSAAALGRIASSPLKSYEWCLLGLGLTQVEAPVALIIVSWLFALAYRERHQTAHPTLFNLGQVLLVGLSVIALVCLGYAVHRGLVVQPSMQVEGMGSTDQLLRWYADRTQGAFPEVTLWSAPLWIYKALMLLWALWLAASLIRWLRWGLRALRTGGGFRTRSDRRGNPKVSLADLEAAEAALKQSQAAPPGPSERGPEGAGAP